ncbi:tyrosine phosphatase family-domain-containing protein [Lophiotrema nucula]|uniref:diphosphoinositol-polyphosphate diphosphatase n=1 Tax=Lophiotrema nucula TaxID=690887 RepID=A0A6A5ZDP0_9PLEO|nr:tyrosine phosphatase family-domain-containing protein [Lophiotrema nucula]
MSITNGVSEPADAQARAGLLQGVKTYLRGLAWPIGEIITDHAVHSPHEDVAGDVQSQKDFPVTCHLAVSTTVTSHGPTRLRSLLPPANFGAVIANAVYRSSYPMEENYEFMKSLGLKTILTLVPEELSFDYMNFMVQSGIQHYQTPLPANKGEIKVQEFQMKKALDIILDRSNHPILIHCNKGKHRTGCVVGCLRRLQGEELNHILDEYHTYADPKARILDECFIQQFDQRVCAYTARSNNWFPPLIAAPPPSPESPVLTLSVARPRA